MKRSRYVYVIIVAVCDIIGSRLCPVGKCQWYGNFIRTNYIGGICSQHRQDYGKLQLAEWYFKEYTQIDLSVCLSITCIVKFWPRCRGMFQWSCRVGSHFRPKRLSMYTGRKDVQSRSFLGAVWSWRSCCPQCGAAVEGDMSLTDVSSANILCLYRTELPLLDLRSLWSSQFTWHVCFWTVGGNRGTQREPIQNMLTQHRKESNSQPSCCEAAVVTTALLCPRGASITMECTLCVVAMGRYSNLSRCIKCFSWHRDN